MTNQKVQYIKIIKRYSFVLSTFFFILFFSTCTNPYKKLAKTEFSEINIKNIPYVLPHLEKAIIYKADITFYKNNLSGLLVIKRIEEKNYRIALTTQFGLKIFDFELINGKLNVVFCIDQLNKNMIIKIFEEAFSVLLLQEKIDHIFEIQNAELNQKIWLLNSGKFNTYCIQNHESESIDNISKRKRNSKKISVGLRNYNNDLPGEIILEHHSIKFKMNLKFLQ